MLLPSVSPIAPLKDNLGRKACAFGAICLAVVFTWILTWDFWFVRQPLIEVDKDAEKSELPFEVSSQNIIFEIGAGSFISLVPRKPIEETTQIKIVLDDNSIIETIASFTVQEGSPRKVFIPIYSNKKQIAGHCLMSLKTSSKNEQWNNLFKIRIKIKVVHEIAFGYLSIVIGYVYFFFWSACYYPQIYCNWKRRSVVGFSFDYLALNMTGHLCYGVFNAAMFYNSDIQKSYTVIHPKGELPVKFNDFLFSVHAVTMNIILIVQCLVFERGDQKVSIPMMTLVGGLWLSIGCGLFAAITEKMGWLQYLYYLSYIKVGTTPIKYTPQVYLHYIKKSTEGWSVYSVLLDASGGISSFTQMAIDAVNNDDWDGTLGNPGKLGLSFIAIIYDSIFLSQHFWLYPASRKAPQRKKVLPDEGLIIIEDPQHYNEFHRKLDELKASFFPLEASSKSRSTSKVYDL